MCSIFSIHTISTYQVLYKGNLKPMTSNSKGATVLDVSSISPTFCQYIKLYAFRLCLLGTFRQVY